MAQRQPSLYIPHGGGPCFFMDPMPGLAPDHWDGMAAYLRGIVAGLPQPPSAIVVISAHWEAAPMTVGDAAAHTLLFDYYGFPPHTYQLRYPVCGDPRLAARIVQRLAAAGIAVATDSRRGIDHGVFIPFLLIVPDAHIPIVPLSLHGGFDPTLHFAAGAALAGLRDEGVLIVGSGFSYHNLRAMFRRDPAADAEARAFDAWLADTIALTDPELRAARLTRWAQAPGARSCHPREEHLLPLLVAAGAAAADPGHRPYTQTLLGKPVCAVQFG